jgi:hypothetical protein
MALMLTVCLAGLTGSLPAAVVGGGQPAEAQLPALFTQLGLTAEQRADIDDGRPVAKVLPWGNASEIFVFGAVYIEGARAAYLAKARNINALAGTSGYLGIGELSASATAADLATLTLDPDDIKALKSCREGDCDVQLPTSSIRTFRETVDWSQPDPATQVNGLARGMILDLVRAYRQGGNAALGVYRDKEHPARVADQFETMVSRSAALPDVLPELRQYLLGFPKADLPGADSFLYWEKVDFGMKPTIRVNHGVIYHAGDPDAGVSAVAIKQLYASHYFHTALDVSVCVGNAAKPERRGFYLITLKSSEQDGLTGIKGSMLRRVVVDRTRSSLEKALASIKSAVEHPASALRH